MPARTVLYPIVCGYVFALLATQRIVPTRGMAWWWLEGTVIAAVFVPAVRWGPPKQWSRLGVIWPILGLAGGIAVWADGLIFLRLPVSQQLMDLAGTLVLATAMAVLLTFLARPFRITPTERKPSPPKRTAPLTVLAVLAGGLSYVVLYYVFGGIFFQLFTRPYYENPTLPLNADAARSLGLWFPVIQLGRGLLIVLASLPLIFTLRASRRATALVLGCLLWVVGGLGPLLVPNPWMPARLRAYHVLEILTQNGGLGLVAVWLLRPKAKEPAG